MNSRSRTIINNFVSFSQYREYELKNILTGDALFRGNKTIVIKEFTHHCNWRLSYIWHVLNISSKLIWCIYNIYFPPIRSWNFFHYQLKFEEILKKNNPPAIAHHSKRIYWKSRTAWRHMLINIDKKEFSKLGTKFFSNFNPFGKIQLNTERVWSYHQNTLHPPYQNPASANRYQYRDQNQG